MGPAVAVISAVAGVVGTVASYSQQQKAAKLQKQQNKMAARRSQRQLIREAQIRRAASVNAAAQMGGLGGSALAGGISSLNSQTGEGLGFSTGMSGLSNRISSALAKAQTFSDLASLGFGLYDRAKAKADTTSAAPTPVPQVYGGNAAR